MFQEEHRTVEVSHTEETEEDSASKTEQMKAAIFIVMKENKKYLGRFLANNNLSFGFNFRAELIHHPLPKP